MKVWQKPSVWDAVTAELREHRRLGLGGLLTEDVVRFATARALARAGVDPAALRAEWPHPALRGSRVDLVVDGDPPAALLEFKFPREPNEQSAAWTMALGEVLKDLYRLAVYRGDADRLFVYVESARLRSYMAGAAQRYGLDLDADEVALYPADAGRLPTTAAQIIGSELAAYKVTARRIALAHVDDELKLAVYAVDAVDTPSDTEAAVTQSDSIPTAVDSQEQSTEPAKVDVHVESRAGARREILAAAQAVLSRSGGDTFTVVDVIAEMTRRGTRYADSTIRTMIGSHLCCNAPDHANTTYADVERVDRGTYRLVRQHQ